MIEGSPPRMRGKDIPTMCAVLGGITPAHAGKSILFGIENGFDLDHPRACGEKLSALRCPLPTIGITPAHAGKSSGRPC